MTCSSAFSALGAFRRGGAHAHVRAAAQHARSRERFGRGRTGPSGRWPDRCAGMPARAGSARAAVHGAAVTADPADPAVARLLAKTPGCGPGVRGWSQRVRGVRCRTARRSGPSRAPPATSWSAPARMSRIVAERGHGALMPCCVLCVTRHGPESAAHSGTLCGMRVVVSTHSTGFAFGAAPEMSASATVRRATRPAATACSAGRGGRRTVCRTSTPSRWNMPEALVGVTVRQPCCPVRDSRSVTPVPAVVLAMQRMATIVALVRRESKCPPVRMV
ncbi:hypothetical protein ACVW19_002908 [Streptomyces sp. TE5632]